MRSLRIRSGNGGLRRIRVCAAMITSSVDGLCRTGVTRKQNRKGEENTLFMVEEHATIEKFRVDVWASPCLSKSGTLLSAQC